MDGKKAFCVGGLLYPIIYIFLTYRQIDVGHVGHFSKIFPTCLNKTVPKADDIHIYLDNIALKDSGNRCAIRYFLDFIGPGWS